MHAAVPTCAEMRATQPADGVQHLKPCLARQLWYIATGVPALMQPSSAWVRLPWPPPLLCCCAPRCDLGERAGSRARGPGVHRRGSVRTKAKAASISHLTSCAQKTATVLRENVTSFLFKYSTLALQIIRFCKYDFRRFPLCFWCCCGFRADMQSAAWKEFGCPASSLAQHNWSFRTKQHRHAAF